MFGRILLTTIKGELDQLEEQSCTMPRRPRIEPFERPNFYGDREFAEEVAEQNRLLLCQGEVYGGATVVIGNVMPKPERLPVKGEVPWQVWSSVVPRSISKEPYNQRKPKVQS